MSNRTLIEINHDFMPDDRTLAALQAFVRSNSRENAAALAVQGINVISTRHHSSQYLVSAEPEGFPLVMMAPAK